MPDRVDGIDAAERREAAALPPGPDLAPEDQARIWLENPCDLLEACHRRYGDLFTLRLGGFGTIVIVADPAAARELFLAPAEAYECRHFNASYRYAMGDHALFLQDGAAHRRLKRMIAPPLREENLDGQAEAVARAVRRVLAERIEAGRLKLRPALHEVTLRALLSLAFGGRTEPAEQIVGWFRETVWRDLRSWKAWTAQSRLHPRLRPLLSAELDLRRAGGAEAPDLLGRLLVAADTGGGALSDEEIQDQIFMLIITAGDAVAVAASWALWRVAAHPEVQEGLRHEAAAAPEDILARPYLSAVVQEVLRLHTVLPTVSGRRLTAPRRLGGYELPAGITLAPCEYLVHRRPGTFSDPLQFRPDRFQNGAYSPQNYFPFGGGARSCLGARLAPLTIRAILATIVDGYRLGPITSEQPRIVRHGTLLAPAEDLSLSLSPA